ncbi:MAG: hypothetical protein A3H96_25815 [Acidobacteria bacterium RIFCSPLOWO2_02_FULL_67_36]|nr:MAG: hypothetical protein A3H96_25815 [Acidobacteria bacterium RIFCSPLOWO2_02_FULL_67_36]OFW23433.1 MAG: hypothetical protein A3G21_05705 [Acidobacteria bacterium RIFCSPLOWO2_12_FULL_66_21]
MKAAIALASIAIATVVVPAQKFSVSVEGVRVDVLVTDGRRPVAGLGVADFELRDSGVLQHIDSVALEDVPLSVMLVLDTSASVAGQPLVDLKRAASAVVRLLAKSDRAALMTFWASVTLASGWTGDRAQLERAIAKVGTGGFTALHDAAYAGLTLRDNGAGRTLVVIFSDGQDTASWLPGQTVIDIARRNDAVVYAVGLLPLAGARLPGYRLDFWSGIQFPVPKASAGTLMESFLDALAEDTGGQFINAERSDRLRDTFVRIVNESRSRYLLTYSPQGVDAGGWHPIEVTVKGRKLKIKARRGYLR